MLWVIKLYNFKIKMPHLKFYELVSIINIFKGRSRKPFKERSKKRELERCIFNMQSSVITTRHWQFHRRKRTCQQIVNLLRFSRSEKRLVHHEAQSILAHYTTIARRRLRIFVVQFVYLFASGSSCATAVTQRFSRCENKQRNSKSQIRCYQKGHRREISITLREQIL